MVNHLPLAVKNGLRNRRRSLLTILSIAASLSLLGVLMAMYQAFYLSPGTEDQAFRLITRNRISLATPLPVSYRDQIKQVPGVREVMIFQWFGGVYKDTNFENFFARFAVEADKEFLMYPTYRIPDEQKRAFQNERTACVAGRPLADRYGWKLGDRITLMGDIYPVDLELTLRGIYDAPRDNENLFFHYLYLREAIPASMRDYVGTFIILAKDRDVVPRIAAAVDKMFVNSPAQTKTETERAFEMSFLSYLGNVKVFLLAVCGAVTFTLLLVTGNTMAMSVRERVREVGILKTLGFTPGGILGIVLTESVLLSVIGAFLGLGVSEGLCAFLRRSPTTFADLKMLHVPYSVIALSLLLAVFIGLASAAIPAWSASKRPIIDCLRFND